MDSEIRLEIAPIEEIAVAVQNARRHVQQFLAPIQETFDHAAAFAKLFTDFQVSVQRTVEKWMAEQQLSWTRMAEMMGIAMEGFERYRNEEEPEACKLLSDAGWLEMDRHFGLQHLREMVGLHQSAG